MAKAGLLCCHRHSPVCLSPGMHVRRRWCVFPVRSKTPSPCHAATVRCSCLPRQNVNQSIHVSMKSSTSATIIALLLLGAGLPANAADSAPASAPAGVFPATLKPLTFDEGRVVFDFNERLRFEDRQDNFDFTSAAHSPTDGSWFLQRFRAGFTWKQSPDFSFQLQVQDVREWGSERPKVPFILGAEGNDAADLRIASVTLGDPKKSPVVVTLGRQVLSFGEERLVGPADWNNFARTFDAGKQIGRAS